MAIKKKPIVAPEHIYVPKHEILPIAEAKKVLEKFHCKPTELPLIFVDDPALNFLATAEGGGKGVKPGDMIKITRKSATAGESFYYRYVVET